MGCGGSKEDDLPLVVRCRERKELIKAAADHRYALAAAHMAYFRSMAGVGDALRQFIDEELLIASPSASPVLTLPSSEGKAKKKNKSKSINNGYDMTHTKSSSSNSLHSGSGSHIHLSEDDHDHDGEGSHLHLSSRSDSDLDSSSGHIHLHDSPDGEDEGPSNSSPPPQTDWGPYGRNPPPDMGWGNYGIYPPQTSWGSYAVNSPPQSAWNQYGTNSTSYAYYMKRSSPQVQSVIYDPMNASATVQVPETSHSYLNSHSTYAYENGGLFGYSMRPPFNGAQNQQPSHPTGPPPPPSPKASAWDFLNPFEGYDSGYPGYYSYGTYGYGSISSSPDSTEVREREGIPDLEDETESEAYRETYRRKNLNKDKFRKNLGEGSSRDESSQKPGSGATSSAVPSQKQYSEGSPKAVPSHGSSEGKIRGIPSHNSGVTSMEVPPEISEATYSVDVKEVKSSPDTFATRSTEDGSSRKKGVTFEVETTSMHDMESSRLSSFTASSARGTRDLQEVVAEIRDEFVTASNYGKEVAMLLEVGKLPHQPKFTLLRVILSRILYMVAPSLSSSHSPSRRSVRLAFSTMKLAKAYYGDFEKNNNTKPSNLSSTLEKLYVWEKKLYKEVKDEERLRIIYEKLCKRLKVLDDRGAEPSKIGATQASITRLLTKLNVCIKAVDAISSRIHKLRDEELQPQVSELIYGLIRMWKSMLKCHQKQFQAIIESKARSLRTNTGSRRASSLRATFELEIELLTWCNHFHDWIATQKSFVESLNGWLLRCIFYEPEVTPDGIVPFSPGRIGAPRAFVICNDWSQAMETISEKRVAMAMKNFASSLEHLLENQGEELRRRFKAEYPANDFEKQLRNLRMERGKIEHDSRASLVSSDSGVSPMDDLKVDLDLMKARLAEERARNKDAAKLISSTASSSIQAGLIPIFEALGKFTSEALKAYEHVRIQNSTE